jgi:hypothetical protein
MKYVLILAALGLGATAVLAGSDAFAHQQGARFARLKAADTNGDGMLSRAEAAALPRLAERFETLDANRDGQVTRDEMRAARAHARGGNLIGLLDADGDGRVSKAEALAKAEERFNRADANRDGFLSAEELPARHGKGHRHGHGRGA